jgi:hypothetical protein
MYVVLSQSGGNISNLNGETLKAAGRKDGQMSLTRRSRLFSLSVSAFKLEPRPLPEEALVRVLQLLSVGRRVVVVVVPAADKVAVVVIVAAFPSPIVGPGARFTNC